MCNEKIFTVQRPVWAIQTELFGEPYEDSLHTHEQAQLILTLRGMVICQVNRSLWIIPPNCALWVPAGVEHCAHAACKTCAQCVMFIAPNVIAGLPPQCCLLEVSLLLRELILAVVRLPSLYDSNGAEGRLVLTMLDQLLAAPIEKLHLVKPVDSRLQKIADAFLHNPEDRASLHEWADRVAMSVRSLQRLVADEVGMSFGQWRQQYQTMLALRWLKSGESIQSIAFKLGYDSPGAFSTMFRRVLGEAPTRYVISTEGKSSARFQRRTIAK